MKTNLIYLALLVLFISGCATAPFSLERSNPIDSVHEGAIRLGNKTIPLPQGKWKVIARGTKEGFFKMFLLKEHTGKKFSYIHISVDTSSLSREHGYVPSKHFNRINMNHVVVNCNTRGGPQDAWSINHIMVQFNPNNKYPIMSQAAEYIRSNDYVISDVMIAVRHLFTGKYVKRRYLNISYIFNPEAEGIGPVAKSDWASCDWHKMRINKDPKKKAYIEKLKKQGADMHERIRASLGKYY